MNIFLITDTSDQGWVYMLHCNRLHPPGQQIVQTTSEIVAIMHVHQSNLGADGMYSSITDTGSIYVPTGQYGISSLDLNISGVVVFKVDAS